MKRQRFNRVYVRRRGERGFALLEILVAFVILALGLGAISTGVALAMRSDARTQTSRVALRLAQSRLEAAGISDVLYAWLSRRPDRGQDTDGGRRSPKFDQLERHAPAATGVQPAPAVGAVEIVLGRSRRGDTGRHRHETRSAEACAGGETMDAGRTRSSSLSRSSPPERANKV